MIEVVVQIAINLTEKLGYFGIFFGMLLESALIPIPSEIIMPLAGFLVSTGEMRFGLAVFAGTMGNLVGSIIAYTIGAKGGETFVSKLVNKYGKYILLSQHEYEKALKWTYKYGLKISFFSRFIPGIRTIISLPLGMAKVNFAKFCIYTFLGSLLWSTALVFIGFKLGENWESLAKYFKFIDIAVILAFFLLLIYFVYKQRKRLKAKIITSD